LTINSPSRLPDCLEVLTQQESAETRGRRPQPTIRSPRTRSEKGHELQADAKRRRLLENGCHLNKSLISWRAARPWLSAMRVNIGIKLCNTEKISRPRWVSQSHFAHQSRHFLAFFGPISQGVQKKIRINETRPSLASSRERYFTYDLKKGFRYEGRASLLTRYSPSYSYASSNTPAR